MATNATLQIALRNKTGSSNSYAYITGLGLDGDYASKPVLILSDGYTVYQPPSPRQTLQPLEADCAISLGEAGSSRTVTIPRIAGGRIWFVVGGRLTFLVNPGPAMVEPSAMNPTDANYGLSWGFCELSFNETQLFANISYVDFVSLPISLELRQESGRVQTVAGLGPGALDRLSSQLLEQDGRDGAGWAQLVVRSPDGAILRVLSPNSGIVMQRGLFEGYYQPYVDAVWQKYGAQGLTINTQAEWGDVNGRVEGEGNLLTFDGVGSFAQPSTADIFSCSTGPFGGYPSNQAQMGALGARLAAALNRSTLLINSRQPEGEQVANFYRDAITNHYARICHDVNLDGRGYAFPYDDVGSGLSTGGPDQAGTVFASDPALFTVTVGTVNDSVSTTAIATDTAAGQQVQKTSRLSSLFQAAKSWPSMLMKGVGGAGTRQRSQGGQRG